jgi:hypothetical protein
MGIHNILLRNLYLIRCHFKLDNQSIPKQLPPRLVLAEGAWGAEGYRFAEKSLILILNSWFSAFTEAVIAKGEDT